MAACHRKVLANIGGISKPAIRRLARRAGVKRLDSLVYEAANNALKSYLKDLIRDCIAYSECAKRRTVTPLDVLHGLKNRGTTIYTFQDVPKRRNIRRVPVQHFAQEDIITGPNLVDHLNPQDDRNGSPMDLHHAGGVQVEAAAPGAILKGTQVVCKGTVVVVGCVADNPSISMVMLPCLGSRVYEIKNCDLRTVDGDRV